MENEIKISISVPPGIENLIPKITEFLQQFNGSTSPRKEIQPEDDILTITDLCDLYKIPKTKVYAMTMKTGPGSIPRFKIGRDLRFKRSELIEWFNTQRIK